MFGMPEVSFKTDFCELVQTNYITAYSHELKMPLYTTFTIDKKAVNNYWLLFQVFLCLQIRSFEMLISPYIIRSFSCKADNGFNISYE